MAQVQCPTCKGSGKTVVFHNTGTDHHEHFSSENTCSACNGTGKVSSEDAVKFEKQHQFWAEILNG